MTTIIVYNDYNHRLRSTASRTCVVMRTHSTFGNSVRSAGPRLSTSLPSHLKDTDQGRIQEFSLGGGVMASALQSPQQGPGAEPLVKGSEAERLHFSMP